jgi:hypothetical protein
MVADAKWGPLAPLAGVWEGDNGLDVSFVHRHGQVRETRFRERAQFAAFGPVENGRQVLYGLDYRTAAWREGEQDPFHTEVGYWLWDAADGQVMRCFVVPRGSMVLAGGTAAASDRAFTMDAEVGSETYGVLSNRYLSGAARTELRGDGHVGTRRAQPRATRPQRPQPARARGVMRRRARTRVERARCPRLGPRTTPII